MTATDDPTPENYERRLAELEQRLTETQHERDQYREKFLALADEIYGGDPNWQPPPVSEAMTARDLIAELER